MGYQRHKRTGQTILAKLNLHDRTTDKFPQVVVLDEAGTPVGGSPFDLSHVAGGRYQVSIGVLANGQYTLHYTVYAERGHVTILPVYGYPTEEIEVDNRIGNIDTAISTRQSEASALSRFNTIDGKIDIIDNIVDQILVDTDVTIPGLVNALNDISIADVQTALTNQGYTAARAILISNLDVLLSTRSSQASVDLIDSIVDAILVDTDVTIPGLINALNNLSIADIQTALTNQGYTSARAILISNLDALISSRQSEADALSRYTNLIAEHDDTQSRVTAIQNNTNFVGIVPTTIVLPLAGTKTYRLFANLFDSTNNPEDPDANALNVRIEDATGTPIVATVAMTRDAIGRYHYDYVVNFNDTEQQLRVFFEYEESAVAIQQVRVTEIREFESKLDDLISKLGNPSGASLSADVASIKNDTGMLINDNGLLATIPAGIVRPSVGTRTDRFFARLINGTGKHADPDLNEISIRIEKPNGVIVWPTTLMTRTGVGKYQVDAPTEFDDEFGQRIVFFEYDYQGETLQFAKSYEVISADVNAIEAQLDAIEAKIDSVPDDVWNEPAGDHAAPGTTGRELLDAGASAATPEEIAGAVWDEQRASHDDAGSFGEFIDASISSRESETNASTRANVAAKETTVQQGFSLGAKDATVAKEGTLSTKASQASVDNQANELALIKGKTDSLSFDSGRIRSKAEVVTDKEDYGIKIADKADIADRVWDEASGEHVANGSTGKALQKAATSTDPLAVADAVWNESATEHVAAGSMGGKLNETRNEVQSNRTEIDKTNARLTVSRASKLDNLDQPISSRQSEADALLRFGVLSDDHDTTHSKVDAVIAAIGSDPNGLTILSLLNNGVFGLAQLKIGIDSRSSSSQVVAVKNDTTTLLGAVLDGTIGLGGLRTVIDNNLALLQDGGNGLTAIHDTVKTRAAQSTLTAQASADEIAAKVWSVLTSTAIVAGSFGKLVKDNLNETVSSRASQTSVNTIDSVVDSILALLQDGTNGLAQIVAEINENEVLLNGLDTHLDSQDTALANARADILAAIAAIVNGTPTILAALEVIKGAGWDSNTDSLEKIRDAIGTGSATLGNQSAILAAIEAMHGTGTTPTDTVKQVLVRVNQAISEILGSKTQVLNSISVVDGKVVTGSNTSSSVLARLEDVNFGLAKAKVDRDAFKDIIVNEVELVSNKVDEVESKIDQIQADLDQGVTDILNDISGLDVAGIKTKLDGVAALLTGGSGLATIKNALTALATNEANRFSSLKDDTIAIKGLSQDVQTLITDMAGAGFNSPSHSLVAVIAAVDAISNLFDGIAEETSIAAVIQILRDIQDGDTGTFDKAANNLKKISSDVKFSTGFDGIGS